MGNSVQILAKLARNAAQLGLTVNSQSASAVVIENGANDLTISYIDASIQQPMGGVSPSASPFLGIGIANPGKIAIKGAAASDVDTLLDSATAAKVLAMCAAMANDIQLQDSAGVSVAEIRGHADIIGLGQ